MPLWDKLKTELDRAGRAAHSALDEGKLRLDVMRARQSADAAAQKFGYAVFRARQSRADLSPDEDTRHMAVVGTALAEVERLETLLKEAAATRKGNPTSPPRTA